MSSRHFLAIVSIALLSITSHADDPKVVELRGQTMGTTYSVKVFTDQPLPDDLPLAIDAELRRVNDQMSTYLKSSELGRFNASASTEWFDVSAETAKVLAYAQQVSEATEGAFDVTVGPLVNLWGFGPGDGEKTVPADEQLAEVRKRVGYAMIEVRADPPAIRKANPEIKVDLSALAKGHGVDRVVELLASRGLDDVFVEIGGEVRTSGDKAGQWWKVGIQIPDVAAEASLIAHPMSSDSGVDEAMATSGDYRIFFETDGKRFSHTIDPRTGRPIEHRLASVSVIMPTCMEADAWATAINVIGRERGLQLARERGMSVLLISRNEQAGFELKGTGVLQKYAPSKSAESKAANQEPEPAGGDQALATIAISTAILGLVLFGMSIGVILRGRAISGSCGGLNNTRNEDGTVSCSVCSNPASACKELRERMKRD